MGWFWDYARATMSVDNFLKKKWGSGQSAMGSGPVRMVKARGHDLRRRGQTPLPPHAFPETALVRFRGLANRLIAWLSGILTRRSYAVTEQSATRGESVPVRRLVRIPDSRTANIVFVTAS